MCEESTTKIPLDMYVPTSLQKIDIVVLTPVGCRRRGNDLRATDAEEIMLKRVVDIDANA